MSVAIHLYVNATKILLQNELSEFSRCDARNSIIQLKIKNQNKIILIEL